MLRLAWKNLLFKPLNTSLSLLLFALGTGLIALLIHINTQVKEQYEQNLAGIDLVIGAKGSPLQLILCNMYHVDNPTGNISLQEARPFLNPKHPLISLAVPLSLGDNYRGYRIVGTSYRLVDSVYSGQIAEGKLWQEDLEVTVGAEVALRTGLRIGDRFHSAHGLVDDGINIHDHGDGFEVVGILQASGTVLDQLILTNTSSIWAVHEHEEESALPESSQEVEEHKHEGHHHEDHDHEDDHHEDDHSRRS